MTSLQVICITQRHDRNLLEEIGQWINAFGQDPVHQVVKLW
jgi:hypothetical protein